MNRYIYIFLFLCVFTIAVFVLFEESGLSFEGLLQNESSKTLLACISFLVLSFDVILPVPSSVVMISNGVLLGALWGGLLSVTGGLLSAVLGYYIGAKSKRLAAKFTGPADEARAKAFLEKYGYAAIIASRPIPVLAESVAIISGTLNLRFGKVLLNSAIGLIPIAFVYSFTGAYSTSLDNAFWAFGLNIGVAGIFWLITWWRKKAHKWE
jgi:uncharacterized membrane protein YdjX (TVP38/TMEM64 family)